VKLFIHHAEEWRTEGEIGGNYQPVKTGHPSAQEGAGEGKRKRFRKGQGEINGRRPVPAVKVKAFAAESVVPWKRDGGKGRC